MPPSRAARPGLARRLAQPRHSAAPRLRPQGCRGEWAVCPEECAGVRGPTGRPDGSIRRAAAHHPPRSEAVAPRAPGPPTLRWEGGGAGLRRQMTWRGDQGPGWDLPGSVLLAEANLLVEAPSNTSPYMFHPNYKMLLCCRMWLPVSRCCTCIA